MRIGEMLIQARVINELQLHAALAEQARWGGKLGTILVRMGALPENLLVMALCRQLNLPKADVEALPAVPPALMDRLNREICERYKILPLAWVAERRAVQLAMADPFDVVAVDDITRLLGTRIEPFLAGENQVLAAIRRLYAGATTSMGASMGGNGSDALSLIDNAGNARAAQGDGRTPLVAPRPGPAAAPSVPPGAAPSTPPPAAEPGSFAARVDEQARVVRAVAELLVARGVISPSDLPRG